VALKYGLYENLENLTTAKSMTVSVVHKILTVVTVDGKSCLVEPIYALQEVATPFLGDRLPAPSSNGRIVSLVPSSNTRARR
jgi:hypothetical protein